jgi:hypothetical protein
MRRLRVPPPTAPAIRIRIEDSTSDAARAAAVHQMGVTDSGERFPRRPFVGTFDRDPDIHGIRALNSCRAHTPLPT